MESIPERGIRFTLLIDAEPDGRFVDPREATAWHGLDRALEELPGVRDRLSEASGAPVHFEWFVRADPQVDTVYSDIGWALNRYVEAWGCIAEAGDGIGLHIHPYRWLPQAGDWMTDFGDPAWIEHCCRLAFEAYERSFGAACQTFRFGDGWMDARTMDLIETLGTRFDATIEPGRAGRQTFHQDHPHSGTIPSWGRAPREPYWPSARDVARPGRRREILEVPVSTVPTRDRGAGGRARRLLRRQARGATIPFLAGSPQRFQSTLRRLIRAGGEAPYIRIPFRTSGFVNELRPNLDANLAWLYEQRWLTRCRFVTIAGALAAPGGDERLDRRVSTPVH